MVTVYMQFLMVNGKVCPENVNLLETALLMANGNWFGAFFSFLMVNGKWFSLKMQILMVNGKWFTWKI